MSTTVKVAGGIVVVIALAVGVWLIRPLFVDEVVDEGFPAGTASGDTDAFPLSAGAVVPPDMTQDEVEAEMAAAAAEPGVEEVEPMPGSEPTQVATGPVEGFDSFHTAEGTATVYELADGSRILRLEDFQVTNGPDLRVYVGPLGDDGEPNLESSSVQLGPLKGNIGNQNYDIPADADLAGPLAVVIYCQPFAVTFATAVLG